MINDIINNAERRMQKSIESLRHELTKLRTGRAHPSLLEQIKVEYYDQIVPLTQVASIAVENTRTLTVSPWEKDMVGKIEKAIRSSELGLNPATAGMLIRVPLPALTEERRKDLAKIVRDEAEQARIAIRNVRRESNNDLKDLLKKKEISEDDEKRSQSRIQKLTDQYIVQVDAISGEKEQDLLAI